MTNPITERIMLEIIEHEGIVPQAYKDSVGVWTWGVGVTDASGHRVKRYRNNPQTIERCLEVYEWLLRVKYLPAVLRAFDGHDLSEAELGAALSFHWNTGAIERATWVKSFMVGKRTLAMAQIMNWCKPPEIRTRRRAEQRLFFKGLWSSDGIVPVYTGVTRWRARPTNPVEVDIRAALRAVVAGAADERQAA
jgi:GH24 family phage-related lysozyme (muramidase)